MKIDQERFEITLLVGIVFFIGFVVGLLIAQDKSIKYDLNNDGKINLTDIVLLRNYILEEENGEVE